MALDDTEHRLAAILSPDVVGYSRLMEADEESTVQSLRACRAIIDRMVADHRDRVFGSAGDSVVAKFASRSRRCAVRWIFNATLKLEIRSCLKTCACVFASASTSAT